MLNITTIRPAGWTKADLDKANKAKRKVRARARRVRDAKAQGRILRAKPGQPRKTGLKPWERLGMSQAKYYRKGLHRTGDKSIRTHQDIRVLEGTNKILTAEPSGSLTAIRPKDEPVVVPYLDTKLTFPRPSDLIVFTSSRNPIPTPPAWKEAA